MMAHRSYVVWGAVVLIAVVNANRLPSTENNPSEPATKVPIKSSRIGHSSRLPKESDVTALPNTKKNLASTNMEKLLMRSLEFLVNSDERTGVVTWTKAAIILKITQILEILFYATGTAFFICTLLDCKGLTGGLGGSSGGSYGGGGGGLQSLFSRNDFENLVHRQSRPVLQAIKNGQQLYQQ